MNTLGHTLILKTYIQSLSSLSIRVIPEGYSLVSTQGTSQGYFRDVFCGRGGTYPLGLRIDNPRRVNTGISPMDKFFNKLLGSYKYVTYICDQERRKDMKPEKFRSKQASITRCNELEATVVVRHEKRYQVCDEDAIPEGAVVVHKYDPIASQELLKAKASPRVNEVVKKATKEEMKEWEKLNGLSPIGEGEESKMFKFRSDDSGIEMSDKELEKVNKTYVPPVRVKKGGAPKRKRKVVVRQTEPLGIVTIVTIDLREAPKKDMIEELRELESCGKIEPSGGAVNVHPLTDEWWSELMESCISVVNRYYSDKVYLVSVERIK